MYINQTYQTNVGNECNSCEHKDICKWRDEKVRIDKELSNMKIEALAPITLSANCKSFIKAVVARY